MIVAELSNSVNVTEVLLDRQSNLAAARNEYNPRLQLPQGKAQYDAWLAYWGPFWEEQKREEQRQAGRAHFDLGLPLDSCSTEVMRQGWQDAEAEFNEWIEEGELLYRPYGPEVI